MTQIVIGQRWLSVMEPELGLGLVKNFDRRKICLHFPAADCVREYSISSAPIQRIIFSINDTITTVDGERFIIQKIENNSGFITYCCEKSKIQEDQLSHTLTFDGTEAKLLRGFVDSNALFNTRYETTLNKCSYQKSIYRGFIGGRISLLPHQLYVADDIANKRSIRVLLADETGLGKTIEASLILHRLLLCGRITRVLILTPQPLIYQWFVELLRKFNLAFQLVDKTFLEEFQKNELLENPFFSDQLFLSWLELLFKNEAMKQSILQSEWDLIIVDEAHHIIHESKEYFFLKKLRAKTKGMMLLTATPDQLGHKSHFSRLHLLDPARYFSFNEFEKEEKHYVTIANVIDNLLLKDSIQDPDIQNAMEDLHKDFDFFKDEIVGKEKYIQDRDKMVNETLDLFGTGRNIFRNTRKTIKGFPKRSAQLISLNGSSQNREDLKKEFAHDNLQNQTRNFHDYNSDPRMLWLKNLLTKNKNEKYLLICSSLNKAKNIEEGLTQTLRSKTSLFHEELSLLKRDKNAAWFSSDEGAQLMVCSEIGSEGRNFQFAHNLILFDLPLNPELLEQRIGRLDRIGQKKDIVIYIPLVKGTPQEMLTKWYHEGLNMFCKNINSSHILFENLRHVLVETVTQVDEQKFTLLIQETKVLLKKLSSTLEKGRDRLLELNSFRPEKVKMMIEAIQKEEKEEKLKNFLFTIFEQFGILVTELTDKTFKVEVDFLTNTEFPLPFGKPQGFSATFDRDIALTHEHMEFLTWDHPMVSGAMDLVLCSEKGSAAFAFWPDNETTELILESVFITECIAPGKYYMDRFFPQTPLRIVVNQECKDCGNQYTPEKMNHLLQDTSHLSILDNSAIKSKLIPAMIKKSKEFSENHLQKIIQEVTEKIQKSLGDEISRITKLKKMNPLMPTQELSDLNEELTALLIAVKSARIRIDSMRLIFRGKET